MQNGDREKLISFLGKLETEQKNPETADIDTLSSLEIVRKINNEDKKVAFVVEEALGEISRVAEQTAETIRSGGRIIYIGAGTSGRLGVIDAAECPPTFGTEPSQIVGLISGGYETLLLSKEGAEDHEDWAVDDLKRIKLSSADFVIGIAASIRTPYTIAGLEYASSQNCRTALIVCNTPGELNYRPDFLIALPVGPEVITGSTRMKSGSAQKMVLNMISTTAMILIGKTYGNIMVDLQARSEKLAARSRRILMDFLGIEYDAADKLLESAGGSVKTAIVMSKCSVTKKEAETLLQKSSGFLRKVINS